MENPKTWGLGVQANNPLNCVPESLSVVLTSGHTQQHPPNKHNIDSAMMNSLVCESSAFKNLSFPCLLLRFMGIFFAELLFIHGLVVQKESLLCLLFTSFIRQSWANAALAQSIHWDYRHAITLITPMWATKFVTHYTTPPRIMTFESWKLMLRNRQAH